MQINLNVIKTVSYNHEAVIIKISSRVSAIILICGTCLIKAVGVYIFKTLVGVLSLLENVRFVCFLFWVLLLLWLWRVGLRSAVARGFPAAAAPHAVEPGLLSAGSAAGLTGLVAAQHVESSQTGH